MNNYNNINNIATIIPQFNMAFTRKQAKQQQQQQQEQELHQYIQQNRHKNSHQIDFIDASIEWRKNKIKRENCTFEYIV
jgi:hypothetical protein